jgi:hypothetical protein
MVGTIPVFNRDDSSPSERVRNKKALGSFCRVPFVGLWSGRLDLNQRLPRPERGALPD